MKHTGLRLRAIIFILFFTAPVYGSSLKEEALPDSLAPGLEHLTAMISTENSTRLDLDKIEAILTFIQSQKPEQTLYYPESHFNSTSVYFEFDIRTDMKSLLKYTYNPDIPAEAVMPASLRSSVWQNAAGEKKSPAVLWNSTEPLSAPIVVNGSEYTVIAPDIHTGSYYGYDQNRKLILCNHKGKKLFISLSRQKDRSEVGKKGLVLGSDYDWNYIYSGKKGINLPGLGWVSSYMYDSCTIILYYEMDPEKPLVRCAVFKWLRAGWSNLNMVKKTHIYKGLVRHENCLKEVLEHPLLPRPEILENVFAGFKAKSTETLRAETRQYFNYLCARYCDDKKLKKTKYDQLLKNEEYLLDMTRTEMLSILSKEYIKDILRKENRTTGRFRKISGS